MVGFSIKNALEVLVRPESGREPSYGSGYRIGGRLVLTAAHLIRGKEEAGCSVRAKEDFGEVPAQIAWTSDEYDIALLELPESIEPAEATRFGRLASEESVVAFEMYAWPQWAWTRGPALLAGGRHIVGQTYLADRSPQRYLVIEPEREEGVAVREGGESPWEGASGASVFTQNRLVAVQRQHQNPARLVSLEAEPIEHVSSDGEWGLVLRRHGIDPNLTRVGHLDDWLIDPSSVFDRVRIDRFVGKEWLDKRIDAFLKSGDSGYAIIQGRTGTGKSAYLAHLARTLGGRCVSHFMETTRGRAGVPTAIRNLTAQIVNRFGIAQSTSRQLLADLAIVPDYLERLLILASRQESARPDVPFVVIVDGLNESASGSGHNVLDLPARLPAGFFVVASTQPVPIGLDVDCPIEHFTLEDHDAENRDDLVQYVRSELPDASDEAIGAIVDGAEGNWAYAFYVVGEIQEGIRDLSDLSELPRGIWKYYSRFWGSWRDEVGQGRWVETDLPLLCAATAAQESLPMALVAEFGGAEAGYAADVFSRQWLRFFVTEARGDAIWIRPFNSGLVDFAHGIVDRDLLSESDRALVDQIGAAVRERHRDIAERYLRAWGPNLTTLRDDRELAREDEGYGWRHVVDHLIEARLSDVAMQVLRSEWDVRYPITTPLPGIGGRLERRRRRGMSINVPRNAWFESHLQLGDLQAFLNDVEALSTRRGSTPGQPLDLVIDRMTALAMRRSAIEVLEELPPSLVVSLARHGDWSVGQIHQFTSRIEDPSARARLLVRLLDLPASEHTDAIEADALETTLEIAEVADQSAVLETLLPKLHGIRLERARMAALRNLGDDDSPKGRGLLEAVVRTVPLDEWDRVEAVMTAVSPLARLELVLAVLPTVDASGHGKERLAEVVDAAVEELSAWDSGTEALFHVTCLELHYRFREFRDIVPTSYDRVMTAITGEFGEDELSEGACEALARLIRFEARDDAVSLAVMMVRRLAQTSVTRNPMAMIHVLQGVTFADQMAVRLIGTLVDALPVDVLEELEQQILKLRVPHGDFEADQALSARYLAEGDSDRAIRIAQGIPRKSVRYLLFSRLADGLGEADLKRVQKFVAKDWAKQFGRTRFPDRREMIKARARTLSPSAPGVVARLAELGQQDEALALVEDIAPARGGKEWQATISNAARTLDREGCMKLLEVSTKLDCLDDSVHLLAYLCPFMNAEDVLQRLPAFRLIGYLGDTLERVGFGRWSRSTSSYFASGRSIALDFAISRLADAGLVDEAMGEFRRHFAEAYRGRVCVEMPHCVAHLLPHLAGQEQVLIELIAAHRNDARAAVMRYTLPHIPAHLAPSVLELAYSNDTAIHNAICIGSQLMLHPEQQRQDLAAEILRLIENWAPNERTRALGLIAPYSDPARDEVLEGDVDEAGRVSLFQDALWNTTGERHAAWIELARTRLTDDLQYGLLNYLAVDRARLLDVPSEVTFDDPTLAAIAPALASSGRIEDAYVRIARIRDVPTRVRTAALLSETLASLQPQRLLDLCHIQLDVVVDKEREEIYGTMLALAPVLLALGGRDGILALDATITQSQRWWMDFSAAKLGAI